jgi:Protein of unknown function (DUF402)
VFSPGEPVLCRKLFSHGAVMTAVPMRVIADAPDRTVLYQAPDTAFRGARTPAGGKIRDFSAEWVSMDLVWTGGSLIRLIEPCAWQCVDVEFDAAGDFVGWYVNFQEPVRRTALGFDTVDLVLDLVVAADSTWSLKDEDDFERAVSAGQLPRQTAERVRAAAAQMIGVVEGGGPPFSEKQWLSWRPPPHWTVPALPANWAVCR